MKNDTDAEEAAVPEREEDATERRPETEDDHVIEDGATDLRPDSEKPYVPSLSEHQLTETIAGRYGGERRVRMQRDALRMYHELAPDDVIEEIMPRQTVVLNNVAMECYVEFNYSKKNTAVLRQGLKAAELTKDSAKLYLLLKGRNK